jgi:rubrerythrin
MQSKLFRRPYYLAMTEEFDLDHYVSRSRALDLSDIRWDDVPRHPLSSETLRTLRYMQDIESHTIVYLRTLLSTRAIDDPEVATFLACWLYEETFHGRALARFLLAAGGDVVQRRRSRAPLPARIEAVLTAALARAWPDFVGVHMTWGAINELTTLTGYRRLATIAHHPVLSELLARIVRDESRHFFFYYRQAAQRLRTPAAARVARFLVDRFWAPVGSGVQPKSETRFLAAYLFGGGDGRDAARKVDDRIRQLPGFAGAALLEAWIDREIPPRRSGTRWHARPPRVGERQAVPWGSASSIRSSSAVIT